MTVRIGFVGRARTQPRGAMFFRYANTKDCSERRAREVLAGYVSYAREDLERIWAEGWHVSLTVVGVLRFASDVPPQLADDVFSRVAVRGLLIAPRGIGERLGDKLVSFRRSRPR